jgi:hypothetical protein
MIKKRNNLSQKSFTLFEILITVSIFVLIGAGVLGAFRMARINFDFGDIEIEFQASLRHTLEGMLREMRHASLGSLTVEAGQAGCSFTIPGETGAISYYLLNSQIVREHPAGVTSVIGNNISTLQFCCLPSTDCLDCSAGEINISISARKTVQGRDYQLSLAQKVRVRNE